MGFEQFTFRIINDPDCACGSLMVVEGERDIPFSIARVFFVYGVGEGQVRGEHAHLKTSQILCCIRGSCEITLDDGRDKETFILDSPDKAILQRPLVWGRITHLQPGSMLMVLCDQPYDPEEYIYDYETFLSLTRERNGG
ncbi:MAG: hypothetical protein B6D59_02545 [Campylobacteraceae bacterium 4484_4]|nr:MAG: hypothetical protein B6D59_02545 [Campylobacteraceae bacterium 4484_4]